MNRIISFTLPLAVFVSSVHICSGQYTRLSITGKTDKRPNLTVTGPTAAEKQAAENTRRQLVEAQLAHAAYQEKKKADNEEFARQLRSKLMASRANAAEAKRKASQPTKRLGPNLVSKQ